MTLQFTKMTLSLIFWYSRVSLVYFSYWSKFHVNIMTDSELWPFSFIKDWPETRKSETHLCDFCPVSRERRELGILKLARMRLMKYYWILKNARVTSFTISELLKENQKQRKEVKIAPYTQIRVTKLIS